MSPLKTLAVQMSFCFTLNVTQRITRLKLNYTETQLTFCSSKLSTFKEEMIEGREQSNFILLKKQ